MYKLSIVYMEPNGDLEWLPCELPAGNRDKLMYVAESYFESLGIKGHFCGIQDVERQ